MMIRTVACVISLNCLLQAAPPDISNLENCISDVRRATIYPPAVPTFEIYKDNYNLLLSDLEATMSQLPYVYQEAAAKPLLTFLENLGEDHYSTIFNYEAEDEQTALYQQIIPDAALAVLSCSQKTFEEGIHAFEEIVSDLYDGFLSDESRASQESGTPIEPPTYGIIPPLVKFGEQEAGPYTWPADATNYVLGMGCGVVNLPPSQLNGGLIAWSTLGHETGGHDITHADEGLLNELAQKVRAAVLKAFGSRALANYWASCIDEAAADICGYLNMGPSVGIALIGYFRALGDGKLRTLGSTEDPHPIDLLRGYLGAAAVKRLSFKDAALWSRAIFDETKKDNATLYLVDPYGHYRRFPVSFSVAVASTDIVAQVIMQAKLSSLQGHSLQDIVNWKDQDQVIVDELATILKSDGTLPTNLQGPGFYAAYVVASATQAALQNGSDLGLIFQQMQNFLAMMHLENPTWSTVPTEQAVALLERSWQGSEIHSGKHIARHEVSENQELATQ